MQRLRSGPNSAPLMPAMPQMKPSAGLMLRRCSSLCRDRCAATARGAYS